MFMKLTEKNLSVINTFFLPLQNKGINEGDPIHFIFMYPVEPTHHNHLDIKYEMVKTVV